MLAVHDFLLGGPALIRDATCVEGVGEHVLDGAPVVRAAVPGAVALRVQAAGDYRVTEPLRGEVEDRADQRGAVGVCAEGAADHSAVGVVLTKDGVAIANGAAEVIPALQLLALASLHMRGQVSGVLVRLLSGDAREHRRHERVVGDAADGDVLVEQLGDDQVHAPAALAPVASCESRRVEDPELRLAVPSGGFDSRAHRGFQLRPTLASIAARVGLAERLADDDASSFALDGGENLAVLVGDALLVVGRRLDAVDDDRDRGLRHRPPLAPLNRSRMRLPSSLAGSGRRCSWPWPT